MKTSETIGELAKALSAAQSQLEGARKDGENPHFRSKYADLTSCWAACREPLAANGLAVAQAFDGMDDEGRMVLVSTLLHESGEWISSRLAMPMEKVTPQGLVAASTYARRAALCALVGISPADDDGETAEGRGGGSANRSQYKPVARVQPNSKDAPAERVEKPQRSTAKNGVIKSLSSSLRNRGMKMGDLVKVTKSLGIEYDGGDIDKLTKKSLEAILDAVTKIKSVEELDGVDMDTVPF